MMMILFLFKLLFLWKNYKLVIDSDNCMAFIHRYWLAKSMFQGLAEWYLHDHISPWEKYLKRISLKNSKPFYSCDSEKTDRQRQKFFPPTTAEDNITLIFKAVLPEMDWKLYHAKKGLKKQLFPRMSKVTALVGI